MAVPGDNAGLVVHLVNLVGQDDTVWDTAPPGGATGAGTLRIAAVGPVLPRVRVADPDRAGRLVDVPVRSEGAFAAAELPAPHVWQVVLVEPAP